MLDFPEEKGNITLHLHCIRIVVVFPVRFPKVSHENNSAVTVNVNRKLGMRLGGHGPSSSSIGLA
jgi:hypothetical protein